MGRVTLAGRSGNLFFGDPDSPYHVVGLIDDDPRKRQRKYEFGRVVGKRKDLVSKAKALNAQTVLVAVPTASAKFLKDLSAELDAANITMLVLPPLREWAGGELKLGDIHEFDVTDLSGPHTHQDRPQLHRRLRARQGGADHRRRWFHRL